MFLTKFLNPKNDVVFKKIFGTEKHKAILMRFINDILEFKGSNEIVDVTFLSPIQDPEIASQKTSIVDVFCTDGNNVNYIIEMQVAKDDDFIKRSQYYASKAYARQMDKGDKKYLSLKEVIFIAIVDYIVFPDKKAYKSDHIILDKETHDHDLKDMAFTFIELPKFKKAKGDELETPLEQWCRFFKYAQETTSEEMERIIGSDPVIKCAYEAIDQFNWNERELATYEAQIKYERDRESQMDTAIRHGRREGMEKGREEGRAEGREKGREEGREEVKIALAVKMLARGMSIEDIIEMTELTKAQIESLK